MECLHDNEQLEREMASVEKTPLIDVKGAKHPVVAVVGKLQVFMTHLAKIWEHEDVWTYLNESLDIVEDQIEQEVLGEPRAKTVENRRKAQEQKRKDEEELTGNIRSYLESEEGRGLLEMGQRAGWWVEEEGGGAQGGRGEEAGLKRKEDGYSGLEADAEEHLEEEGAGGSSCSSSTRGGEGESHG